ncbi:LANO_0D04918g1_1 [Lachancea nothofagi CBS 11611]|uniref:LANO_0D04918g1_1 n=1 Tax=Lachancea nothofagi CBS 11611 TaxID=1266666 RepID=A0A1G4JGH2_9SACH|nr:LANO_0D04918g1_1 [Lachancea nothofagi CBS 11611]
MAQDAYYITPNEAALAVVATSMKKARLRPETLVCNSIVGGVLFSAGGMLFTACHSMSPEIFNQNPGMLDFMGALMFSIGLFYVVINGADLFNSNILFFSVGLLRNVVSAYDLLISWFVSWFGNFAGTLFVVYVMCYLSGVTRSSKFVAWTHIAVQEKDSATFIQIFIKAIAGNFFVCLAIYLQMMAKPLHVKFLMLTLPIFTFVAIGFTHVVADMFLLTVGMLNGADLSIARFIWKHMVASTLGNVVGGSVFGLVIPFYLHLVVVEYDRKQLSLPKLEARDEQPELNMDSRVVRVPTGEAEDLDEEASEGDEQYAPEERSGLDPISSGSSVDEKRDTVPVAYRPVLRTPSFSRTGSSLRRIVTNKSGISVRSNRSLPHRTPAGVFPIKGMATPLTKESSRIGLYGFEPSSVSTHRLHPSVQSIDTLRRVKTTKSEQTGNINMSRPQLQESTRAKSLGFILHPESSVDHRRILENKMGAKLERALTRISSRLSRDDRNDCKLPTTTQEVFPSIENNNMSQTNFANVPNLSDQRSNFGTKFQGSSNFDDDMVRLHKFSTVPAVTDSSKDAGHTMTFSNGRPSSNSNSSTRSISILSRPSAARPTEVPEFRRPLHPIGPRNSIPRFMANFDNDYDEEQSIKDS